MNIQLFLLFGTFFCLSKHVAASTEALLECGRVHHVDNIQNHSTATASYSNSRCMLLCGFGKTILPVDSIHEGRSCPDDTNGICRAGKCIGGQEDALRECGLKHGVDFHQVDNHQGTAFTNDQCVLRCVVGGDQLSAMNLHEGSPCPANANGICHAGICVSQSTNPGTIVTNTPPTTPPPITTPTLPTTVSKPSIESFSPLKMKLVNISLEFANPSLSRDQEIGVFYADDPNLIDWYRMFSTYGDSSKQNVYHTETINNVPRRLNRTSLISIDLYGNFGIHLSVHLSEHNEDLYALFANFYHNHQLPFGQNENFLANYSLNSIANPAQKLMDVAIRFTILFTEN